jgi:hypothetical protein
VRKIILNVIIIVALAIGVSKPTAAALIDRGGGLIYDSTQNITWVQNASLGGLFDWQGAVDWVDALVFGGFDDWRLPTTLNPDPTCSNPSNGGQGFNCLGAEMGHLSWVDGITNVSQGIFQNITGGAYWSETEYGGCSGPCAWIFVFSDQIQDQHLKFRPSVGAWAVRTGDVLNGPAPSPAPEPVSLAIFALGLAGMGLMRRRRKAD